MLVIVGQLGCSQSQTGTKYLTSIQYTDKVLTIYKDEQTKHYNVDDELVSEIIELVNVIHQVNYRLEYFSENKIDITGTGTEDTYSTSIRSFQGGFLVTNTIKQDNKTIWIDSLLINDRVQYYWDDSLFYTLKPYSQFYIAYKYFKEFIEKPLDTSTENYKIAKSIFYGLNDISSDSTYWDNYLPSFKGRLIRNLSVESPGLYIWDNRESRFINFYEP